MKSGDSVNTSYGDGCLTLYRELDQIYTVQLPFGRLYCPSRTLVSATTDNNHSNQSCVMELNVAYEALENMRKLNLEVACQEKGISFCAGDLDHQCSACLLATPPNPKQRTTTTQFSSFHRLVTKPAKSPPCLICGTPVCRKHASASFRKENITMCCSCETLFGMDYVIDILTSKDARQRRLHMDRMIDLYDRAVLLLKYSAQYIDDIASSLQAAAIAQNRVGLGSSSAGIVSGVLGIVSAATIFTPVGPPLLIASLLFGGTATAAQTGSEVHNAYFSEPNRLADRVIALHGICWNILRVTGTLRDALLLDHLRSDLYSEDGKKIMLMGAMSNTSPSKNEYLMKRQTDILAGVTTIGSVGSVSVVSMATVEAGQAATVAQAGTVATRGARFFGRSTTAAMRAMRFARVAGGTLAAATLVLEAHSMNNTIQAIQAGNPCEKAETLRRIRKQIEGLPTTQSVDAECEQYLETLTHRQRVLTQDEVTKLLLENAEILQQAQELTSRESTEGSDSMDSSQRSTTSLLQRIEMHQRKERSSVSPDKRQHHHKLSSLDKVTTTCSPMSLLERIELHKQRERSYSPPIARKSGVGKRPAFTAATLAVENQV
jgi:hypothetical protein